MKKIILFSVVMLSCLVLNAQQSVNESSAVQAVSNAFGYVDVVNDSSGDVEVEFYNLETYQSVYYTLKSKTSRYSILLPVGEYDIHMHPVLYRPYYFEVYTGGSLYYSTLSETLCYSFPLDSGGFYFRMSDSN